MRWSPRLAGFILAVAVVNAVLYHWPLYAFVIANVDRSSFGGLLTLVTVFFLVTFVTALLLSLLSLISLRLVKVTCMVAAPCSALAIYFVQAYGVVLDKSMMGNLFNTDVAEAGSLFHPRLLLYLLLLGALPCWLLSRVQIQHNRRLQRAGFALVILVVGVGWAYATSKTWPWIDQNSKRLGGMTMPWSYVINAPRYLVGRLAPREQALLPPATFVANDKTIVFLVIGEAARAQDFSLYGYARLTNPRLAEDGVVALAHTRACSTYTTASVLCILSHLEGGRQAGWEPLPSYLQRQGLDVIWRTTNWGEPPLKVQTLERGDDLRKGCEGEGCDHDEVLLRGLAARIRSSARDKIFVVLHANGSHGPSYYSKYPPAFEVFKPVCKSVELHQCTSETLVNAYDNTILYNDEVLHRAIGVLKEFPQAATMLMYISDHGESLGEYGLYLHGTPYSIAPDVQKDVPFLVWMSEAFKKKKTIAMSQRAPEANHSQANVFHSVMGAFDMRSEVYQPQLDLFSGDAK